jgi:pseudaminic acid cytidylyltransferase
MQDKKILAIIPARGGSKRIPRKNIKDFLGKPIIAYSIEAAFESKLFDEVMVSTDDQEIVEVAKKYGAEVPFMRSKKNSDDLATTADVIEEVLLGYEKLGKYFDKTCCIYPTAPFISPERLNEAMRLLEDTDAGSVLPVTHFSYPILRSFKIEDSGLLKMNWPENMNVSSQDLALAYHDSGQFYCLDVKKFLVQKKLFTDNTLPIIIPESEVQDIDNEEDWKIAEIKYQFKNQTD